MSARPTLLRLQPGHEQGFHALRGQRLVVLHGSITLALPATWVSETLMWPRLRLHAGEAHRVDCAGWLRLEAEQSPAEVMALQPEPWNAIGWLRSFGASRRRRPMAAPWL